MKRNVKIIITIVVYIILVIAATLYSLPNKSDNGINSITRDDEGNIYGVSNSKEYIFVAKLDSQGNVIELSRCDKESEEVEYTCKFSYGAMYIEQNWYTDGKQKSSVWMKEPSKTYFIEVCHNIHDDDENISDFYVAGERVGIICINRNTHEIYVYSDELGTEDTKVIDNYFEGDELIPVVVKYGGNQMLYILTQDGRIFSSDFYGNKTYLGIDDAVKLMTDDNGYYYSTRGSDSLIYTYYNGLVGYKYNDLGNVWDVESSEVAGNIVALSSYDDFDWLLIASMDETVIKGMTDVEFTLPTYIKLLILPFFVVTAIYAVLVVVIYLFDRLVIQKKKLRYQTIVVVSSISLVWIIIMNYSLYRLENVNQTADKKYYNEICLEAQSGKIMDELDIDSFDYDNYLGSEFKEDLEALFQRGHISTSWQNFTRQELVYGYETPAFVFSDRAAYGSSIDTYYYSDVIEKIRECIDTGSIITFETKVSGREYVMGVAPIGNLDKQLCLIISVPANDDVTVHESFDQFKIYSIVGWIIMVVFIGVFLRKRWNFVETLVLQMDRVSRGDYRIEKRNVPNNEFGKLWTSLERMCKNIQTRRYSLAGTLDYLNQFAPRNFEKLFERENLQDIEVGEAIEINATMGIISIIDRNTLLSGSLQRQYVQYVNQLMEILFSQVESEQAIFLQNGSNLENVKVIFKENSNSDSDSAITAVRYSIECIESLFGLTETKYNTKPFVLLHTSMFNCGLAGGSKQVYPYVTSLEMETLAMFIKPFKDCNVRMVVTQNTWEGIKDTVKCRYIGYVSSKDGKGSYKLYEILDAYSQAQRQERIKSRDAFEKALNLYYTNDLYLARSMFSDIVKECPDDGIARWYAFASDEKFNRDDNTDTHYELFWGLF